ncbi:hypothetical protein AWC38_SpisGene3514 [Stylophora pistillata]|uniref:Uncharacterized protein n=1 Tax=Stylophora pistillata TaxID=50429 RepID=A0A2B4SRE3_STYPI|nr:hypothetical protein AWC38_SpisGene3514 [Stylophora pistillata]
MFLLKIAKDDDSPIFVEIGGKPPISSSLLLFRDVHVSHHVEVLDPSSKDSSSSHNLFNEEFHYMFHQWCSVF